MEMQSCCGLCFYLHCMDDYEVDDIRSSHRARTYELKSFTSASCRFLCFAFTW